MVADDETLEVWLKRKLREGLDQALAEAPWWCLLCGQGGNYEGERPDEFWFPPDDHICDKRLYENNPLPKLKGILDD